MKNLNYLELNSINDDSCESIGDLSAFIPHITALRHLTLEYYDGKEAA